MRYGLSFSFHQATTLLSSTSSWKKPRAPSWDALNEHIRLREMVPPLQIATMTPLLSFMLVSSGSLSKELPPYHVLFQEREWALETSPLA